MNKNSEKTALTVSRKLGESIMIGDDIEVKIIKRTGNQIRITVFADRSVPIYRKEVWEARQRGETREIREIKNAYARDRLSREIYEQEKDL